MSTSNSTWAELAARGAGLKCYQPTKRRSADASASVYPLVGSIMYEDDDLKSQILASKAMAIVQQALTSGSVLFSFRKGIFGDRVDAYKAIQSQVSSKVEFRPLSDYDEKNDGSLLLEAKFEEASDANKALSEGVNVDGIIYKAVLARESKEFGELKHVQFTLMRIVKEPTFLKDLMDSLSYYGKVLQVKQFTRGGFFEGKFSVMLDTSEGFQVEGEMQEAKPLDRMLYLGEFDCFVAATYKGAPPVCHFCKHSGHIRAKCPELAKRRCFRCGKQGHMLRFCPEEGKQADYLKKQKVDTPKPTNSEEVIKAREATEEVFHLVDQEKRGEGKHLNDLLEDEMESLRGESSDNGSDYEISDQEEMDLQVEEDDQVNMDENQVNLDENHVDDEVVLVAASVRAIGAGQGSAYSKYASETVALSMKVDTPEEMLSLTKLRQETEKKRAAFDDKLKRGSGGGTFKGTTVKTIAAAKGGVSSSTGLVVKGNKAGAAGGAGDDSRGAGRLPSKTKYEARRAQ